MADNDQKPWEQFADAKVVDEKPTAAPATAPAPAEPSDDGETGDEPWNVYANHEVVNAEDVYEGDMADATANALMGAAERTAEGMSGGAKVMDWFGDVGRATLFGPIADPIAALILSQTHKSEGVSYRDALDVVRANNEASSSITASLTGAFLGGGIVASGLKKTATYAATKSGMARGAMQYAARDKILNRVVTAAAAGSTAGAIEEGIRTGLEETIDVTGGHGFDGERVADNVLFGALIGGMATPALQEGMNGSKWFFNFLKKTGGNSDAQTYEATSRILREFAKEGESLDDAANRMRQKTQEFQIKNGRMPAAAEIMSPEQVSNVAEVSRVFNGLDIRARELGEEGVERALRDYDKVVTGGQAIPSPEFIENQMEELFTDVIKRNGDTMVGVNDETMVYLMRNRAWVEKMAGNGNEGAERMAHILSAQDGIRGLKLQHQKLINAKNGADAKHELAGYQKKLAQLLDEAFNAGGADASEIAELRNLIQLTDAIGKRAASGRNANAASFNLEEFLPGLNRANREIDNYAANGLRISLKDANNIRSTASRHFNTARHLDADKADAARRVRDAVAPIGKEEVPEYANVVKRWNLEMNRSEAQETGILAARGDIDLMDLQTRLGSGRIPGKPKASGDPQKVAIRKGAREGVRRQIQNEIGGTTQEGVRSAQRLASSPNAQKAVSEVLGSGDGKAMTRAAKTVVDTYESMKALARPTSVSAMGDERKFASEVLTGAAFGNLGGAGRAALLNRVLTRLQIPRGTAKKMIEMLGDPNQMDKALAFMQKKKIQLGPLFGAVQSHLTSYEEND